MKARNQQVGITQEPSLRYRELTTTLRFVRVIKETSSWDKKGTQLFLSKNSEKSAQRKSEVEREQLSGWCKFT